MIYSCKNGFIIRIRTSVSLVGATGEILRIYVLNTYQQGHCYANTLCYKKKYGPSERRFCKPLLAKYSQFHENLLNAFVRYRESKSHPSHIINSKKALSPRMFKFVDSIRRTAPVVLLLLDCEARRYDELCLLVIMSKHADVISFWTTTHRYCQRDVTML